jgi:response regulator RpfG family c-di-GMP phosphodiesterase
VGSRRARHEPDSESPASRVQARADGSGYPHGVKGEDIPVAARIFALVDALDAMTHDRQYRAARPLSRRSRRREKP